PLPRPLRDPGVVGGGTAAAPALAAALRPPRPPGEALAVAGAARGHLVPAGRAHPADGRDGDGDRRPGRRRGGRPARGGRGDRRAAATPRRRRLTALRTRVARPAVGGAGRGRDRAARAGA